MITTHPPHRDAHEAFVASVDTLIAVCELPGTLDTREAAEREVARRIARFTQKLCSEDVS